MKNLIKSSYHLFVFPSFLLCRCIECRRPRITRAKIVYTGPQRQGVSFGVGGGGGGGGRGLSCRAMMKDVRCDAQERCWGRNASLKHTKMIMTMGRETFWSNCLTPPTQQRLHTWRDRAAIPTGSDEPGEINS